jgi:hypothetical protein
VENKTAEEGTVRKLILKNWETFETEISRIFGGGKHRRARTKGGSDPIFRGHARTNRTRLLFSAIRFPTVGPLNNLNGLGVGFDAGPPTALFCVQIGLQF